MLNEGNRKIHTFLKTYIEISMVSKSKKNSSRKRLKARFKHIPSQIKLRELHIIHYTYLQRTVKHNAYVCKFTVSITKMVS